MENQNIQYAALIPDPSEQRKLQGLIDLASQTPGFKGIPPEDSHLTVGFNPDGFDDESVRMLKDVRDVQLTSAVAQGLSRKHGNLHLMYAKSTKQIAVAIEFPSHTVNELKARLKHTFDGRLSLSHMTIGVLAPETLGVDAAQLEALAAQGDFDAIQTTLDDAFSGLLQSEAGMPLRDIAVAPISLRMEKVHASPHTECPLDITDHPNPISRRENALDAIKPSLLTEPIKTVASWVGLVNSSRDTGRGAALA